MRCGNLNSDPYLYPASTFPTEHAPTPSLNEHVWTIAVDTMLRETFPVTGSSEVVAKDYGRRRCFELRDPVVTGVSLKIEVPQDEGKRQIKRCYGCDQG